MKPPAALPVLRAYRRLGTLIHPLLAELGLQPGQELLLVTIGAESPTQSELVERLGVSQPTIARAVGRLISAGLVEAERDHADGRVRRVSLTPSGRDMVPAIGRVWRDVDTALFAPLSAAEQQTLLALLNRVAGADDGS